MRTFVDRGGTFTDVVVIGDDGGVTIRKVPSDRAVVGDLARGDLVFGTTVATNALLEGTGVRVLLLVSEGFADLVQIGDMQRKALFDPDATWPPPPVHRVVEVPGRIAADGTELSPLRVPDLPLDDVEAVAIALVHSGRNPTHERRLADAIAARRPDLHVAVGHRLSPEVGLLARLETAVIDAAFSPVLRRALDRDRIPTGALAIRSDGSLVPADRLRAPDAVLSGPAGGVLAVAEVARQAGFARAVGLDMGGTSTDVCRVDLGDPPRREGDLRVAGLRIRRPALEVETIAAGGGSICTSDGLRLAVGPASAGADPGPQCYGRGGPPTLTDAALACGLVDPDAFDPPLRADLVALPAPADRFLDVAREAMAQAVRRIATARGVDLADHALVAYGGAAGQHAAEVADRLGIGTVLVHPAAAVLSAWGQALARREDRAVAPVWRPLDDAFPELAPLADRLCDGMDDLPERRDTVELRYVGTDHALEVPLLPSVAATREAFRAEHRRRYGFDRDAAVEVVNVRVRRRAPPAPAPAPTGDPWGIGDREVTGPRTLFAPTTAVHVPPGWRARRVDGLLRLDRVEGTVARDPIARTPHGVALWAARFMGVAEQAGAVLQRLARSVNIKERLDFSCAVFDGAGHLVANAPHIPVHLGAMGETVRDLIAHEALEDGVAWLTNDPAAGGSHLPDLTVVTPVRHGARWFFVASRGHHVDVGGQTPGSMPPTSRTLADEGLLFRRVRLDGVDWEALLAGSREPATVRADLEAQIAANHHAAEALRALGPADRLAAWMAHLQDVADEAVVRATAGLSGAAEDIVGGIPLRLALSWANGRLRVDLTGTGGPHPGNLNAPRAVVRAAVLYALRVLVRDDIPLNEGALRRVDLVIPAGSLLDPPQGAAIVGGNVETSQRIADLVLRAARARAAGQGTMNNLTLGGDGWSLYETIGGGQGASAAGPGVSGRQVHMTNTRATDVEVLESRHPLRVRRFGLRRGSGGDGHHRGGDGLVRELEVTAPATASLLATRRRRGAPGLGGGDGLPGVDTVIRGGRPQAWDGAPVTLAPGDRVRIETPGGGGWRP